MVSTRMVNTSLLITRPIYRSYDDIWKAADDAFDAIVAFLQRMHIVVDFPMPGMDIHEASVSCVYVCVYACMASCVCVCGSVSGRAHACTRAYMHVCMYACTRA